MENKNYFVSYYSNSFQQVSNLIINIHPIIWLSRQEKHLPAIHILFWKEIEISIAKEAERSNYISVEDWSQE